jgi:putative ABC transport system substrate-binding protein
MKRASLPLQRRTFIAGLGGAVAWPLLARGQDTGRVYRLGSLNGAPRNAPRVEAFFDELRVFGFVEGQNLNVDPGGFGLRTDQFVDMAAVMAKSPPNVVFCGGDAAMRAAQATMQTLPIVGFSSDMVRSGLVRSLSRPGGNITGVSVPTPDLDGKRQDILTEAVPGVHRMAALADPTNTEPVEIQTLRRTAHARDIDLVIFTARTPEDIEPAMRQAKASGAAAINVLAAPLFSFNRTLVIKLAAALQLPAIYEWPDMAEDGGLIGYGPRIPLVYRQTARLLVKVFRGVKPADIPVEQPTNYELVINLKTAKALGLDIPPTLLARADEVIE